MHTANIKRKARSSGFLFGKSFEECRGYMHAHYLELDKRAREKGVSLPAVQGDPCEVMKTMGRIR